MVYPLETIALSKIYQINNGRIEGITDANLRIEEGQILALLGPNGAGKTTFIRVVCSELRPDRGKVLMDGISILESNSKECIDIRRKVGYAPEIPFFYGKLTGWELSHFMESIYGYRLDEGGSLSFKHISEALALAPHLHKQVGVYSQGTVQKLMLAYAIAFGRRLIILDEPSNSLDPDSYMALRSILYDCRSRKRAILLSTHQLSMAQELADEVAIISQGRMQLKLMKNNSNIEELYIKAVRVYEEE